MLTLATTDTVLLVKISILRELFWNYLEEGKAKDIVETAGCNTLLKITPEKSSGKIPAAVFLHDWFRLGPESKKQFWPTPTSHRNDCS